MGNEGRKAVEEYNSILTVRDRLDIAELELRSEMAKQIMKYFIKVNFLVLLTVLLVFGADSFFLYWRAIDPVNRIITANVVISIIGATTLQFGAIAFLVSQWLFAKGNAILP
jgi:hypothetical protein